MRSFQQDNTKRERQKRNKIQLYGSGRGPGNGGGGLGAWGVREHGSDPGPERDPQEPLQCWPGGAPGELPTGRVDKGSVHMTSAISTFSGGREPALKERRPEIVSDFGVLLPGLEKYLTRKHHIFCIRLHPKCEMLFTRKDGVGREGAHLKKGPQRCCQQPSEFASRRHSQK